jgi:radical SAM superfamily enzyme YgiQ (UPF0313 family)
VGITAPTTVFHNAKSIAQSIKRQRDIPIVIGGPHITLLREKAMLDCLYFDYGVCGEGEETFKELIEALEGHTPVENIQGLIYRKDSEPVANPPRAFITQLDDLPLPDFSALRVEHYSSHIPGKGIVPFLPVATSRGCPYGCIYCSAEGIFGRKVRFRSVENVLDEFEYIANELHVSHLAFVDETLTLNKDRFLQLCNGMEKRGLKLTLEGWTRAETLDDEILAAMKKAGFTSLSLGIESGDPEILKVIRTGSKLPEIVKAFDMAKRAGLETKGFVMIGHPYETRHTVENTFKFIRSLKSCDEMYINITTPFPGTKLYDMAVKGEGGMKLLTENYAEYRKYGNAVITVNDLSREDLIRLQKKGFLLFYLHPKRIWHRLKRAGIKSAFISGIAFLKGVFGGKSQ